jgi:hypothetical protein
MAKSMRQKYLGQKGRAKERGIPFELTFEQWRDWWLATGHYHERGRKRGQYAMARVGDTGPYALGNIYCTTSTENVSASNEARIMKPETLAKLKGNDHRRGKKASPATRLRSKISAMRRCGTLTPEIERELTSQLNAY